jgi:hypothetical protein
MATRVTLPVSRFAPVQEARHGQPSVIADVGTKNACSTSLIAVVWVLLPATFIPMNQARTDFLFATPSFLTGAGTVFNLPGSSFIYVHSSSGKEADAKAIASDWAMAGKDIRSAVSDQSFKALHGPARSEKRAWADSATSADPQILSNLSKDKRNRLLNALPQVASVLIEKHSFFSGPLPPTEMLQEYNRLIPNGAERIMTMAESQSAHR